MFSDLQLMVIGAMGNWKIGNRLSPFCQPVIPIYIVDSDPDFDFEKPELHAIALEPEGPPVDKIRELALKEGNV
ncbi:hypothetical protein DSCOOX_48000 [Desulfosarcina ovata subsp. ovata]|uniref:Uncharacterized protein n=1 Tax=Desulfosarcina ovata subsp. ovata TaxID=2752305 RepID=A0A5K8AIA9_9BACT|nr:hypothetical protein DSCOOX_48000 [Desulfosarcina ovata subsp. ovata]